MRFAPLDSLNVYDLVREEVRNEECNGPRDGSGGKYGRINAIATVTFDR